MQAGNIIGVGSYIPALRAARSKNGLTPNATPFWMVGGAGAEVEIDTETGHVKVTRLVNVADVGRPINPRIVETQLIGRGDHAVRASPCRRRWNLTGQVTNAPSPTTRSRASSTFRR